MGFEKIGYPLGSSFVMMDTEDEAKKVCEGLNGKKEHGLSLEVSYVKWIRKKKLTKAEKRERRQKRKEELFQKIMKMSKEDIIKSMILPKKGKKLTPYEIERNF